jgi:Uma2 family endonuclease
MTPPTWQHILIEEFIQETLNAEIRRLKLNWRAFRGTGQRTDVNSSRLPDVMVLPLDKLAGLERQTAILQVPAILAVEVVSPSTASEDYNQKKEEYQKQGISEYWIVDHEAIGPATILGVPKQPTVSVFQLIEGAYQSKQFRGDDRIVSLSFPDLQLTANQVFSVGRDLG